jgi:hypothetical protein
MTPYKVMLQKIRWTLLMVLCLPFLGRAAEGMWIPALLKSLNEAEMKSMGLRLSAEDIYSVNKSSLKDAVVHFGGGCTAEVVSPMGLIFTNHHCGYSQIQSHSSVEKDYLTDGFWAMSRDKELANPGLTASFIQRIEDVTKAVLEGTEGKKGAERQAVIDANIARLEKDVVAKEKLEANIEPFFYGNEYYMIVTKTYRDVRLVGAPPGGVGKFGGDTDNWMWPRHTGDFSVFRIYADKNNEPADYSPDNIPYKPKHFFPVSAKGVKEGDFTMVYGFPGQTQQYLHSAAVNFIVKEMNPRAIAMRDKSLELINASMASSDAIRIAYAAKQARIANAWKKWIGETKGLQRLNAIAIKLDIERRFQNAVDKDANLRAEYGTVLGDLSILQAKISKYTLSRSMLVEFFFMGPEVLRFARAYEGVIEGFDKLSAEGKLQAELDKLKPSVDGFFKNYHAPTDQRILAVLWPMYLEGLDPALRPDIAAELQTKYAGDWSKMATEIFASSYFTDAARLKAALNKFNKGTVKKLKADPAYRMCRSVMAAYREKAAPSQTDMDAQMAELMRTYVRGLMKVFPDKRYWPDANSTLRLAYGKLEGSQPADGVQYKPFCTLDGVLAKYIPGDVEFDLPERLVKMAKDRDYGPYADADGNLNVTFTASNQTTGGNSGSPVLDGDGNLIGINFDRSWESTMSDVMYDPTRCRNIIVDARYVLFVIDRYAGASNLMSELKVVR